MKTLRLLALAAIAVAAYAAPAQARLVQWTSPSGNIDCMGSTDTQVWVDCVVEHASWPATQRRPRPANCEQDWVPTEIQLQRRKVTIGSCRGDVGPVCVPGFTSCRRLGYGSSIKVGGILCTSHTNGMTCRYKAAPRVGFRVSREGFVRLR